MRFLTAAEVEYCKAVRQATEGSEQLPAISVEGKLYVKAASFPKEQQNEAIAYGRQKILDEKTTGVLVEDAVEFTFWYLDPRVKELPDAGPQVSAADRVNLDELMTAMRGPKGISIQDRRHNLRQYPSCFIGSEAVLWLMGHLEFDKIDATRVGQRLLDEKFAHHVADSEPFRDGHYFYRFYRDE
ncbi:MAG: hypothetical protein AAF704_11615 [Cyanobacteria bacterium P01_D01_bin.123]